MIVAKIKKNLFVLLLIFFLKKLNIDKHIYMYMLSFLQQFKQLIRNNKEFGQMIGVNNKIDCMPWVQVSLFINFFYEKSYCSHKNY